MKTKIWLALLALYIVWGSTYLGIKIAIETIPPFLHAGLRFLVSGLILVLWQRAAGQKMPSRHQWSHLAIIGLLLLLGGNGLVAWAEQFIPSGVAALVIASQPAFLVIIEALRPGGSNPTWRAVIGLLIGFAGIFILLGPQSLTGSQHSFDGWGVAALLGACTFWGIGSTFSKGADLPSSSLMATGAEMLVGSIGLFLVSALLGEWRGWSPMQISARSLYGLLYLITVGSIVGFGSYIWLLKRAPLPLVSTYAYVNPIIATLLGAWLGSEPLEPRIGLAAAIIIGAIIFINTQAKPVKIRKEVALAE